MRQRALCRNTAILPTINYYYYTNVCLGARNRNYYRGAGLNGLGRRYNNVFQPMG